MEKTSLDYVLVTVGLTVLAAYHLWLLRQIIKHPNRTVIGINAISRRFWVRAMMEDVSKNGVLAVQTLRNNIMASTLLAMTAIMLTSLIAVLMTSGGGATGWREGTNIGFLYGNKSELGYCVKFFCILVCFLVSFLMNVQSIRYYSHASILINVPYTKILYSSSTSSSVVHNCVTTTAAATTTTTTTTTEEYVGSTMNKGSYFWSLGLRAFYFSFPLFLWIFGPIPMVSSCLVLVFFLYFLDVSSVIDGWPSSDDHHVVGQDACPEYDDDLGAMNNDTTITTIT